MATMFAQSGQQLLHSNGPLAGPGHHPGLLNAGPPGSKRSQYQPQQQQNSSHNRASLAQGSPAAPAGLVHASAESAAGSGPFAASATFSGAPIPAAAAEHTLYMPTSTSNIPLAASFSSNSTRKAPYPALNIPQSGPPNGPTSASLHEVPPPAVPACPPSEHKHLFHAYIYDYLFKQGFSDAARAFLVDAPDTPIKRPPDYVSPTKGSHAKEAKSGGQRSRGHSPTLPSENSEHPASNGGVVDDVSQTGGGKEFGTSDPLNTSGSATSPPGPHLERIVSDMGDEDLEQEARQRDDSMQDETEQSIIQTGRDIVATKPGTSSSENSNTSSSFGSARIGDTSSKDSAQTSHSTVGTAATSVLTTSMGVDCILDGSSNGSDGDQTPPSSHAMNGNRSNSNNPSFSPKAISTSSGVPQQLPSHDPEAALPRPDISIVAPQGFLYEWWTVFWDVFRARGDKGGSPAARAFIQASSRGIVSSSHIHYRVCKQC